MFRLSLFERATDARPRQKTLSLDDLKALLNRWRLRSEKDGPLWSPASYDLVAHRGDENVSSISCLVLDFDDGFDWSDFEDSWQRWTYCVHTSFSHTKDHPKWRAVFPLAQPVQAEDWANVYASLSIGLSQGLTDPSCKDRSRMYYLPSHPEGEEQYFNWHDGELLQQSDFPAIDLAEDVLSETEGAPTPPDGSALSSCDDYDIRATWEQILEPHGWVKVRTWFGGHMALWRRPGKRKGISARTGIGRAGDRFYAWTSNAPPIEARVLYRKYALLAMLEFGGDYTAVAKHLAASGYGKKAKKGPKVVAHDEQPDQGEFVDEDDELTPQSPNSEPRFEFTDLGNARRLVHYHGEDLHYCGDWGRWLVWDGVHWVEDAPENPLARGKAHAVTDAMLLRTRTRTWGRASQGSAKISNMLREAQALPSISVRAVDLDSDEHLLCAKNGVIDLRTGRFIEHSRSHLITKQVAVDYDPDAKCPVFESFLIAIMKERRELVDLLIRALGYSLTGSTKEQKFFMLYGKRGRNGKSTLMDIIQELLGDGLCFTIRKKLLTDSDNDSAKFSKALLEGKRVVYANETKKNARFDVEFIKDFVGGQRMEAERKGKDGYQFKIRAKLWYAVNNLPGADFDNSFRDRVVPIPFEQSYYTPDNDDYRDGDLPPDKDLPKKLLGELPGILALLVKGCLRWQEMGELGEPGQVKALKAEYQAQNDSVSDWLQDRCLLVGDGRTKQADAWKDYVEWVKETKPTTFHGKRVHFKSDLLDRKGITAIAPKNVDTFAGFDLRSQVGMFGGDE